MERIMKRRTNTMSPKATVGKKVADKMGKAPKQMYAKGGKVTKGKKY